MLTSPNGKIYIGQTIRPIEKRFKQHLKKGSGCVAIYNAIQYHGWGNFEKDWYECPDEDLNFDEELLVREMGTLSPSGYNLREGGGNTGKMSEDSKKKISEANKGKTHTEETKKKWSEMRKGENNSMYGKNHTEETRKKIGEINLGKTHTEETKKKWSEMRKGENNSMYGKNHTEETRKKIGEINLGKTHTEETKQKMSEAKIGKIFTEETRQKLSKANIGKTFTEETKQKMSKAKIGENNSLSKKVFQYSLIGEFIQSFASSGEAARALDKSDGSSIGKCARGKRNTAHGFKWSLVLH